ncbi:hypothetical protein B0A48_15518 [Cryoendolithus antarcticus]|uniref:Uncharacterized protein n=1 Tax=Cryoendolithus antarcticus TaxID=1507870 RepID=A0A1V8SGF1_9PEZI|nr:hypothetical protein B0A48_15518 [Cryoendolithus antarcticus]
MCLAIITTGLEYTFRYWHNWTEVEEARLVAFLHRILAEAAQSGAVETIKDFVDANERSAEVIEQAAEALTKPRTAPRVLNEVKLQDVRPASRLTDIREVLSCITLVLLLAYLL